MSQKRTTEVKDRTGREIFEGDVCEFTQGHRGTVKGVCTVVFDHGAFRGKQVVNGVDYFVPFAEREPAYNPERHFTVISP